MSASELHSIDGPISPPTHEPAIVSTIASPPTANPTSSAPGSTIAHDPNLMVRTFYPFSRLPIEVRIMVYTLMLPKPCLMDGFKEAEDGRLVVREYGCSKRTVPIVLQICREARTEFITSKQQVGASSASHPRYTLCKPFKAKGSFYIDLERDHLFLALEEVYQIRTMHMVARKHIQHVVLHYECDLAKVSQMIHLFSKFESLKSATFIIQNLVRDRPGNRAPFGGLPFLDKEPRFYAAELQRSLRSTGEETYKECRDGILRALEKKKERNPKWVAPKVFFRPINLMFSETGCLTTMNIQSLFMKEIDPAEKLNCFSQTQARISRAEGIGEQ